MNICKENFDETSCQLSESQVFGSFKLVEGGSLHFYAELNGLSGYTEGVELCVEFTDPTDGSGVKIKFDDMFSARGHRWLLDHAINLKYLLMDTSPEEYIGYCISSVLKERVKLEILRDENDVDFNLDLAGFCSTATFPYNEKLKGVIKEKS